MKCVVIVVAVSLLGCSYGQPVDSGVYAYQDTNGNRYSGTYNVKDGRAISEQGEELDLPFPPFQPIPFQDIDSFFPEFLRNFENTLEEVFRSNIEDQKKAFDAARKAYEVTSNESGHVPNLIPRAAFDYSGGAPNSAYAAGFVSPFEQTQIASINPQNPNMKNVNVQQVASRSGGGPGVYSVSSVASSSSMNVNGKEVSNRFAETTVNKNGEVTKYTVRS